MLILLKLCSDDGLKNMEDIFSNGAAWTAANERIEKKGKKAINYS
jgi:hypothetical protein